MGLNLAKQNDLYQEIQFLISVVIIPFYFLMTGSKSNILTNKKDFVCFMQGETTGRKLTPKDVRNMVKVY